MTSASEVFVVQLARASRKANKFVRHLPRHDREDVLAAALLWCWEHRDSYSLTTSLDTWFVNAVRDAYKNWQRGEIRNGAEVLNEIPTGDSTLATVEAWEAAAKLAAALPPEYRRVIFLDTKGYTRAEMEATGIPKHTIDGARARTKQMRRLLPDEHEFKRAISSAPAIDSDDTPEVPSRIDQEIEQLDAMPRHGADCPVCFRCMWFYGFLPSTRRPVKMEIHEPIVAKAVRDTEARKLEIAKRVRAGTLKG